MKKSTQRVVYVGDPKASPEETEALTAGLVGVDAAGFEALLQLTKKAMSVIREQVRAVMTLKRARKVRMLRVTCSLRAVAATCHRRWQGAWLPASNQLAGVALCEQAAKLLGEDPQEEPWVL